MYIIQLLSNILRYDAYLLKYKENILQLYVIRSAKVSSI